MYYIVRKGSVFADAVQWPVVSFAKRPLTTPMHAWAVVVGASVWDLVLLGAALRLVDGRLRTRPWGWWLWWKSRWRNGHCGHVALRSGTLLGAALVDGCAVDVGAGNGLKSWFHHHLFSIASFSFFFPPFWIFWVLWECSSGHKYFFLSSFLHRLFLQSPFSYPMASKVDTGYAVSVR